MSCPRCGAEMRGGICPECGFPVNRLRMEKKAKNSGMQIRFKK